MQIAVTTPNGHVGRHLSRLLVRAGCRPLLVTPRPERLPAELLPWCEARTGDVFDPDSFRRATDGVDALYFVSPPSRSPDPLSDYARAGESLVHAVERNRLSRVVFQSSVGAEKRHGVGEIDGLAGVETALETTSADITHLRCGFFFTNLMMDPAALRDGVVRTVLPLDFSMPWVAPRDIAETAALLLMNRAWSGRQVRAVHGPEDLSWNAVADTLARELDRTVKAERVTDQEMLRGLLSAGLTTQAAAAALAMSTGIRDDFTPEQERTALTTTPTTLASWICDELRAFLAQG